MADRFHTSMHDLHLNSISTQIFHATSSSRIHPKIETKVFCFFSVRSFRRFFCFALSWSKASAINFLKKKKYGETHIKCGDFVFCTDFVFLGQIERPRRIRSKCIQNRLRRIEAKKRKKKNKNLFSLNSFDFRLWQHFNLFQMSSLSPSSPSSLCYYRIHRIFDLYITFHSLTFCF